MIEIATTLVLIGILTSMAAPRMNRHLDKTRMDAAMNQIAADLTYARVTAVRSGYRAALEFEPVSTSPTCYSNRYTVVVQSIPQRVIKTTNLDFNPSTLCLNVGANRTITYNSRGLLAPFNNRTIRLTRGEMENTISLSTVGRIYRGY